MLPVDHLKKADPKLRALMIGVLVGMSVLVVGLWHVQIYSSKRYWKDLRQQSYRTILIPATRGKILDRNGIAFADNRPSHDVNLYLGEIRNEFQETYAGAKRVLRERDPERLSDREYLVNDLQPATRYIAASNLVARLGDVMGLDIVLDRDGFTRHFNRQRSLPMTILRDIQHEESARFLESGAVPNGFDLDMQALRRYRFGEAGAQFVGYMMGRKFDPDDPDEPETRYRLKDYEGAEGLEHYFDRELRGRPGVKTIKVDSMSYSRSETITTEPVPGDNLVVTVDIPLQLAVEQALASAQEDVRGAAVVMNPNTGDILAMASLPSYDPNLFTKRISHEDFARYNDDKLRPMRSRVTHEIYQPGSIFKIIVGLAMLEHGVGDPDAFIRTQSRYRLGRRSWNDTAPPGMYDLERAFKRSSNYYFIEYGLRLGRESIAEMATRFHLNDRFEGAFQSSSGIIPTDEFVAKESRAGDPWTDGDTANISIGQGDVTVTPLHIAVMVSAIANGGTIYSPRLVQRLETQVESGDQPQTNRLFPVRQLGDVNIRSEYLGRIRNAMLGEVVDRNDGTGWKAAVPGMEIGGKTGTAEFANKTHNYVWFASMSPMTNAKYVVVVMVEDGKSGGSTCAPVARQIYEAIHEREAGNIPSAIEAVFNERIRT